MLSDRVVIYDDHDYGVGTIPKWFCLLFWMVSRLLVLVLLVAWASFFWSRSQELWPVVFVFPLAFGFIFAFVADWYYSVIRSMKEYLPGGKVFWPGKSL